MRRSCKDDTHAVSRPRMLAEKKALQQEEQRYSHTGTRTRVCWVRASYPNLLDDMGRLQIQRDSHVTKLRIAAKIHEHESTPLPAHRTGVPAAGIILFSNPNRSFHIRPNPSALYRSHNLKKRYDAETVRPIVVTSRCDQLVYSIGVTRQLLSHMSRRRHAPPLRHYAITPLRTSGRHVTA